MYDHPKYVEMENNIYQLLNELIQTRIYIQNETKLLNNEEMMIQVMDITVLNISHVEIDEQDLIIGQYQSNDI